MNLDASDQAALVAFLRTLTDTTLATDERWSDPFAQGPLAVAVTALTANVPATGGSVEYEVEVTNTSDEALTVAARVVATLPNEDTRVVREQTLAVPAGATVRRTLSDTVPAAAPAGDYTLRVEVGAAADVFTFVKDPPASLAPVAAATGLPTVFALHAPFPNPARAHATLPFDLPDATDVTVEVLDVRGRRVALLVDQRLGAGQHQARWDAADAPSGIYLVRLIAGTAVQTQRVTLVP